MSRRPGLSLRPRYRQPASVRAGMKPIPREALDRMLVKGIHLRGQPAGCVWILDRIEGDLMHLRTPVTNRKRTSHVLNACYTRRNAP